MVQGDEPGEPTVESDLGERPPGNKLAQAVARARIAQELFAVDGQVKLGRYHVLEMVGAGGMGVVWGAWDPELERRVAIKLVAATQSSARDRIVREGQALAKLSHPNVVPVYDVGVVEPDVYIVLEWVSGKTLRNYCSEPRTVRQIVSIYRDAGHGLAAAHHAGLIHRDFKPDNAIRGDDGRVRVLDFGLARADLTDTATADPASTGGVGTPKYMAPEQAAGSVVTAAVDQYAFCVSLREALVGRCANDTDADVPRWLAEIIERGTAAVAADRFASMDAVVAALARDPATVWRRRVIAAVAVGAVGAAFAIGNLRHRSDDAICTGGRDEIAGSWDDATRGKLRSHLEGLGPFAVGEATRLDGQLGGYASAWAAAHDHACLAEQHAELTPQLYERTLGCLGRSRAALDTIVGVLSTASVEGLGNAIVAAHSLPDPDRCATDTRASKLAPPPRESAATVAQLGNDIDRARVLAVAVDPSAVETALATVTQANNLGYSPLVARANLVYGLALTSANLTKRAVEPLSSAVDAAIDADDDETFIEAYALDLYAVEKLGDATGRLSIKPLDLLPYAERIAKRPGAGGPLARARLYNEAGVAFKAANDLVRARSWWEKAAVEAKLAGHAVELADIHGNLALLADEPERSRLAALRISEYATSLGPDHAFTLRARASAALLATDPHSVAEQLRQACRRLQQLHPHLHAIVAPYWYELGWLAEERGDADEAKTAFTLGRDADDSAAGYLQLLDGKLEAAAAAMTKVADEDEHAPNWWDRVTAADALLVAAISWHRLGRDRDAESALSRGVTVLEGVDSLPVYARRLARQRAMLARLIAKPDPARARDLAARAVRWYRAAGGYDAIAAELQAIMDSH